MKVNRRIFAISSVALTLVLSTVFAPFASASNYSFDTEAKVKAALYAAAAYDCISTGDMQKTAIGNDKDSILKSAGQQTSWIGTWLGDEQGMISCSEAIKKTFGTGRISENDLSAGNLLYGVYNTTSGSAKSIKCNYGIVNSSGTGLMDDTKTWPAGYIRDQDGDGKPDSKMNHGAITIVYDEDGPLRLEGATSDIDVTHTLESMQQWSINWSNVSQICQKLVMYTEVYPVDATAITGEAATMYEPVLATDDGTPFNEWGIHVDDSYHAWVHSNSAKFTHTAGTVTGTTFLKLKDGDKSREKLLENISQQKMGGTTSPEGFLNEYPNAKYILYGRYLFNGDGAADFACNGTTVATDDPEFDSLNESTDYWTAGQPYVASISAYSSSAATSKSSYRTKFGGNGAAEPGTEKSINFPGVIGNCKTLAEGTFNNIQPTSGSAKVAVKNFMGVTSVADLPRTNTNTGADEEDEENAQSPCTLAGGPLSWILCPVLSVVGKTVQFLYGWIEDQFLVVDANFYDRTSETYNAWKDFQGYANIFFIILLVLIILSQVTGFGITNYGIKKTLPKLILAIVLINLSFFICQVAVDLSNIIGDTVENLLGERASSMGSGGFAETVGSIVSYAAGIGEAAAIGVGAITLATLSPELFASWMPMIILVLIGCVLGVLFFFIILCVRQAAIIVLIILSPLAIAAYALPNTKKMFDRWFKLFTALLLVYPICGLLMGGGRFVSSLLIENAANGDGGLGMILVGLLANIVPFFLVPTILKSSMAAMGNLGAKISGFGDRMSRTLGRGVLNSESFKERQRQAVKNRHEARAERLSAEQGIRQRMARGLRRRGFTGSADALERSSRRDLARSASAYKKAELEDAERAILARNATPEALAESVDAARATMEREYADKEIKNLSNLMALSDVRYTDGHGVEHKINADDVGSLLAAQEHYMAQAHNASDESTRQYYTKRAQAAQQLLFAKGDTGRSKSVQSLYDHVFGDGTPGSDHGKSDIAKAMASRISADGKWMADLKNEDPGTFQLVNDLVGDGNLQSRATYEMPLAEKFSPGAVPKLSDNTLNNIVKNIDNIDPTELEKLDKIFTRAMTDERISKDLRGKKEIINAANAIHKKVYGNKRENFVKDAMAAGTYSTEAAAEAAYEKEHGKLQKLEVNEPLKVPRKRATAPGDWRRDPLNNNNWYEYKNGVPHRALNPEEVKKAEWIENHNIDVDMQNQLDNQG